MSENVQTLSFRRCRLPHWLVAEHAYFVTVCRKGCLPSDVVDDLRKERAELASKTKHLGLPERGHASETSARTLEKADLLAIQRHRFLKIEAVLDAAERNERDLCDSGIAPVILGNLDWLRGLGWRLWAVTLMPSHMHLVLRNAVGNNDALREDLSRFLAYTARQINASKGTAGAYWQHEPLNHWCRDGESWMRSVNYTVRNPVEAGLVASWRDWPYTVVDPEVDALLK